LKTNQGVQGGREGGGEGGGEGGREVLLLLTDIEWMRFQVNK